MKCGKTPFEGEGLVKIPRDSPCMMVFWKLLNTRESLFGACYIGFLDFVTKPPLHIIARRHLHTTSWCLSFPRRVYMLILL